MLFGPNKMEVECSVDTCEFWDDSYCSADKLKVNHNKSNAAHSSEETCCKTFITKND